MVTTFRETLAQHGIPVSTLTDNGMVYTTRLSGGKGGRNGLETELRRLNIVQKNSRPNHPTTCGKVERFQQTMKKWLRAQPAQPATLAELQVLLDAFVEYYNQHRPHRSLPHHTTPATAYNARPKAIPGADRTAEVHHRVRTDRIDNAGSVTLRVNGRLHHIGVGRTHNRTRVLLLVQDLEIRSSTPPPANSCANSPSTPHQGLPTPRTPTRPNPQTPLTTQQPNPQSRVRLSPMS